MNLHETCQLHSHIPTLQRVVTVLDRWWPPPPTVNGYGRWPGWQPVRVRSRALVGWSCSYPWERTGAVTPPSADGVGICRYVDLSLHGRDPHHLQRGKVLEPIQITGSRAMCSVVFLNSTLPPVRSSLTGEHWAHNPGDTSSTLVSATVSLDPGRHLPPRSYAVGSAYNQPQG